MDLAIQALKPVASPVRGDRRPTEAGKEFQAMLDGLATPADDAGGDAPEPDEAPAPAGVLVTAEVVPPPVAALVTLDGLQQPAAPKAEPAAADITPDTGLPPVVSGQAAAPQAPPAPSGLEPDMSPGDAAAAPQPETAAPTAGGSGPQATAGGAGAPAGQSAAGASVPADDADMPDANTPPAAPAREPPLPPGQQPGADATRAPAAASAEAMTPRHLVATHVPVGQVSVHVGRAAADGADRIEIHLSPASLGQVDVELEVTPDGRVDAVVRVERPETLELLQRDARQLARALQDAGLQADGGSLSFHLRGDEQRQPGQGWAFAAAAGGGRASLRPGSAATEAAIAAEPSRLMRGGVDIRV